MEIFENIHFIGNPFTRPGYFTSTSAIIGKTVTLIDVGTSNSAEESIFPYLRAIGRDPMEISLIILTHGHGDHCGSVAHIARTAGAKIACHTLDAPLVENPKRQGELLHNRFPEQFAAPQSEPFEAAKVDILLGDGSKVNIDGRLIEVVHTPGHSAGSICLIDRESRVAFSGDSIQGRGERRPLIFHSYRDYVKSLERIRSEEISTLVAGHPFPPLNQGVLKGSQVEQFFAESAIAAKELEQAVVNTAKASKKGLTIKHLLESIPTASPSTVCCLVEYMVSEGRMVFDGSNYYYRS